ncbi:MAG: HNH endonuclease signature motif containing protein [Acidimicrobiales bacterium]
MPGDDDQRARFSRTLDGRGRLDADLGPDGALIVGSTLDRIMDDLWRRANSAGDPVQPAARRRADALVEMARRASAAGDATAARPLFIVRCDLTDLFNRAGWQAGRPATAGLFDDLAGDPDQSGGPVGSREPGRTAPQSGAGGSAGAGASRRRGSAGAGAAGTANGWDTSDRRERRAAAQFGPEALWDWRTYGRPTTDTGHPVDPYFFRELLCDADLVRAICDGPSQILDVGRAERTVTGPQRHALSVRDGGCIYPGCDRPPGWCHAHHIKHWENGGLDRPGQPVLALQLPSPPKARGPIRSRPPA